MIINIFGPSGSGKTTLIRNAIHAGVIPCWLGKLTNESTAQYKDLKIALSTMPIPKFRGSVESYLNLFDIELNGDFNFCDEVKILNKSIFPNLNPSRMEKNLQRPYETLSAGEGRRLSIMRCLLEGSDLRVIDEPFANSSQDLYEVIINAIKVKGDAILLSHDPLLTNFEGDLEHIVQISVGDARITLEDVINDI